MSQEETIAPFFFLCITGSTGPSDPRGSLHVHLHNALHRLQINLMKKLCIRVSHPALFTKMPTSIPSHQQFPAHLTLPNQWQYPCCEFSDHIFRAFHWRWLQSFKGFRSTKTTLRPLKPFRRLGFFRSRQWGQWWEPTSRTPWDSLGVWGTWTRPMWENWWRICKERWTLECLLPLGKIVGIPLPVIPVENLVGFLVYNKEQSARRKIHKRKREKE